MLYLFISTVFIADYVYTAFLEWTFQHEIVVVQDLAFQLCRLVPSGIVTINSVMTRAIFSYKSYFFFASSN